MLEFLTAIDTYTYIYLALFISMLICLYLCFKIGSKNDEPNDFNWLTPPENHAKINDHTQISFRQYGSGTTDLLFIHGIGANTYCWRLLFNLFNLNEYRLTFIDLPGFGYSTKNRQFTYSLDEQCECVNSFVNQSGLVQPILIGSSMGGTIALSLAIKYPKTYNKVVAIAPAADKKLIPFLLRKIKNVSFLFNWILNKYFMVIILKVIFCNKNRVTRQTINGYLTPYIINKTGSIDAFVKSAHLIMDQRFPSYLSQLKITPLILASKKDRMVKKLSIKKILSNTPNYEFKLHTTAGHHLMEDDPQWVYSHIKRYITD